MKRDAAEVEGVGERVKSVLEELVDEGSEDDWLMGTGVEIPSAFASLASLWGGIGDRGRGH